MAESRERWSESAVEDARLDGRPGVRLRSLSDIEVSRKVIVDNVYFVGLSVMRCYCGRFRYAFDDREPFTLEAGELVVVYPEHYVTIEALEARNRLVSCVCDGVDAVPFFDGLGFFDCARGRTSPRMGGFLELRSLVEDPANKTPAGHAAALRYLTDMLVSQLRDLKTNGNAFLYEAARLVHANLKKGLVRLEPLCAQLKVSRSHLHRAFVEAGWPSPSEIIRREQLRLAVRLLREGRLSIPEVMERAGFVSQSHFSTFIRRKTGRTPREIRCGPRIPQHAPSSAPRPEPLDSTCKGPQDSVS